ncbi:MAG: glycosyltransferase [Hyphomonas sp.]
MTHIAFFGHDAADAAVRRRVAAFERDGLEVTGFMMARQSNVSTAWKNIKLGETRDGAFLNRIKNIFSGARIAASHADTLATADLVYARNLDMLACAFLAKRFCRLKTPVVYESLDVHRLLTRPDIVGKALRWIEKSLLRRTKGLVVSSPGFLKNHFNKHYPGLFTPYLIENRLTAGADYGARPVAGAKSLPVDGKLRLGWIGILRCQRSFELLCALADRFPDTLEVHLHGIPARNEIPIFEPELEKRANMHFGGKYRAPEDLADIYAPLDVVWAGDFMEAGYNSVWLLPNRIYEGGYYATPSIAPSGTETAEWIIERKCGFTIPEPLHETLPALIHDLLDDRSEVNEFAATLLSLREDTFIQPAGFVGDIISSVLNGKKLDV